MSRARFRTTCCPLLSPREAICRASFEDEHSSPYEGGQISWLERIRQHDLISCIPRCQLLTGKDCRKSRDTHVCTRVRGSGFGVAGSGFFRSRKDGGEDGASTGAREV